ncbi:MAG: hypothetical protein PF689_08965 [Deltaproteobacteria bacterium]|jgi:hypothetical protein|nr:hypothetical protein [Deltaproteobacteria bacterium]
MEFLSFSKFTETSYILGCILFLVAQLNSCTLADQEDYSGRYLSQSPAPYEEKGPVEICMGTHRIASPKEDLGGFCQKRDNPSPETCYSNSDCKGRTLCVCGVCSVKFCTRNDDCPGNYVCDFNKNRCALRCETDCECPGTNPRCELGVCQKMCIVDGECETGELCSKSLARCITVPCSHDNQCYDDEECVIQMEPRIVREPSVVRRIDNTYFMYVEVDQGSVDRRMIFRAQSYDAKTWNMNPPAPIVESVASDNYRVGSPSVIILDNNNYVMFYEIGDGEGIGRAESSDGRNWTRSEEPLVFPTGNENEIHAPSAVYHPLEDRIYLYYEAGDGNEIKLIISEDSEGRYFPNAAVDASVKIVVLRPHSLADELLWRKVSDLHSPFVKLEIDDNGNPVFKMWVSAKGFESAEASSFGTTNQVSANFSVGFLAGTDGISFEPFPFNPIFDTIAPNSFVNHQSELCPSILDLGDKSILFYGKSNADYTNWDNLGWAQNPPSHSFPDSL